MEGEGTRGEYMGFVRQPNADWLTKMGESSFIKAVCRQLCSYFLGLLKINQFLCYKKLFFPLNAHTSFMGLSVSHFLLVLVASGWALCVSTLH